MTNAVGKRLDGFGLIVVEREVLLGSVHLNVRANIRFINVSKRQYVN